MSNEDRRHKSEEEKSRKVGVLASAFLDFFCRRSYLNSAAASCTDGFRPVIFQMESYIEK